MAAGCGSLTRRSPPHPRSAGGRPPPSSPPPRALGAPPPRGGRQPDLIVDATGRARLAARALKIPAHVGPRNDVAHFAHFENFGWDDVPGQVLIRRLKAGWSWCIPLQDRLSVGIVVDRQEAARLGSSAAE